MRVRFLALTMLMLIALTACGGSAPATIAEIPVFAGATEIKPGESMLADAFTSSLGQGVGAQGVVENKIFTLPAGAVWTDVKAFYEKELGGKDWVVAPEGSASMAGVEVASWTRGNQALSVTQIPDPMGGSPVLVISLTTAS